MSLYEQWQEAGSDFDHQNEYDAYWRAWFEKEKKVYETILTEKQSVLEGSLLDLAKAYHFTDQEIVGFIDGINSSLETPIEVEALTPESTVTLKIDFEKLLFNMHAAKADWLYDLPAWNAIFDEEKRKEIRKAYMSSKTVIRDEKIGRNDPCTCGSGKKYKKCCGANE